RRELRAANDVRRENREAATAAHVLVLAQGGVEVHRLVEGEVVDQQQVVPGAAATHAEVRELAGGGQARQAVQREQRIGATANGASQGLPVEIGAAGR